MRYIALYAYYFIYFIATGMRTFTAKFYGELGLSGSEIGILSSIPSIVAVILTPMIGALADRMPKKRYLLCALLIFMALCAYLVSKSSTFFLLFLTITGVTFASVACPPIATSISLEYVHEIGRSFGPIRMMGTIGYQCGALMVGAIFSRHLNNLYPLMGAVLLVAAFVTFCMPNVAGHQTKRSKISFSKLLSDRHVLFVYFFILFGSIATQFHSAFFTKHLGDLGMSNSTVSLITFLSVMAEIPFLIFGDRLARKLSVWTWFLIGIAANGIRWLGIAFCTSPILLILFQLPGLTELACYDFFPSIYLNQRVPKELTSSAQSLITLTGFGAARVIGSLFGGFISDYTGIPALYAALGAISIIGLVLFLKPVRHLIREDREDGSHENASNF